MSTSTNKSIGLAEKLSNAHSLVLLLMDESGYINCDVDEDGNADLDVSDWHPIDGKQLNHHGTAYTDGEYLMFVGYNVDRAERFLYFMGAENEAVIEFKVDNILIYSGIDDNRLRRWSDDEVDRP